MRLSMSGKIYAVVAMILLVAVIILAISLYSIGRLTYAMNDTARQSWRTLSMYAVQLVALERGLEVERIVKSTDKSEMQELISKGLRASEASMENDLAEYAMNFDVLATQGQLENAAEIRRLWE